MGMKHKHHIIPKYMGGTDDPSNLIELTIEEHAEAHRKLWEENKNWQDYVAWKALSGQISHSEATILAVKETQRRLVAEGNHHLPKITKRKMENGTHHFLSSEWQSKYSRKKVSEGTHHFLGGKIQKTLYEDGKHHFCDIENLKRYAQKRKEEGNHNMVTKLKCEVCGKSMQQPLFKRWGHGVNCKQQGKN